MSSKTSSGSISLTAQIGDLFGQQNFNEEFWVIPVDHAGPAQDVDQLVQGRVRVEEHVAAVAEEVDHRPD